MAGDSDGERLVEVREQILERDLVDAEADLEHAVGDGALDREAAGLEPGPLPDEAVAVLVAHQVALLREGLEVLRH